MATGRVARKADALLIMAELQSAELSGEIDAGATEKSDCPTGGGRKRMTDAADNQRRHALQAIAGVATAALMSTAGPATGQSLEAPARAPDARPTEEHALEAVVVTARKRDEALGDVPIAITAFSNEEMQRMGVRDFKDLALSNPNVKIVEASGSGRVASTVAIRGNIQSSSVTSVDPSVGVYMDGHLISHTFGTAALSVDVVSVQTLKGPQGTLFGRNTTGGAMLVKTQDPTLDDLNGYVQGELGNIGTRSVGGAINVPLGSIGAVRLAYQNNHSGNYESFANGLRLGKKNDAVFRTKVRLQPSDGTRVDLFAEKVRTSGTQTIEILSQPNRPIYHKVPINISGSTNLVSDPRSGERQAVRVEFYGATLAQDIPTGELRLLVGHRKFSVTGGSTLPPGIGFTFQDRPGIESTSVELQYNGSVIDDRVDVAAGLYYFDQVVNEDLKTFTYAGASLAHRILRQDTTSKSAYFQAVGHVSDKIDLTAGLRYTDDSKTGRLTFNDRRLNPVKLKSQKPNYSLSLSYKFVEGSMVYASTSSGYRSGGTGVDPNTANTSVPSTFAPEQLKNYELGLKSDTLGGTLRIGAAAFYQDYRNYQYTAIAGSPPIRVVQNADALIKGFEGDLTWQATEGLRLSGSVGLVDAKVHDSSRVEDGEILPNVPRWTWSVMAAQTFDVWDGHLILTGNYSWRDRFSTALGTLATTIDERAASRLDAVGVLNASATYEKNSWSFSLFANNATNKKYYNMSTVSLPTINFAILGASRVAGARFKYSF